MRAHVDTVLKTDGVAEKLDEGTTALTPALSPERGKPPHVRWYLSDRRAYPLIEIQKQCQEVRIVTTVYS